MKSADCILFFDGVCNLCNRFVDYLIVRDRVGAIKFASLQGETASTLVPNYARAAELDSVVLLEKDQVLTHSDAALRAIELAIPSARWTVKFARVVPKALRDYVYRVIARNRFRWFGKRESCRIPTESERSRLLP
jgi:predicted DCC family thiol-disulfide oxidoreductase YuxK